jgi:hypothetical protein
MKIKMYKRVLYFLIAACATIAIAHSQEPGKVTFNGYPSGMPQVAWNTASVDTISLFERQEHYLLHNRMNFHWYPSDEITGSVQFRNQVMYGDFTRDAGFETGFETESYFLPLTFYYTYGDAGLVSISADRAWLQYTHDNLELKVGRQRINWGQTFVWNPNDIFNAYNFFDFDYAERPGADAARVIYYPNYTSTIEVAAKLDSASNLTAAGLYRFNTQGVDIQFIGGYYSQTSKSLSADNNPDSDWLGGLGITGDYKGVSIRTEATYMQPTAESNSKDDLFLWSLGLDYSFKNELYLSSEFFYSSRVDPVLVGGGGIMDLYSGPLTVKNLAFAKYNAFAQGSYPITPIFKVTLSGMIFTDEQLTGFFIGPYLDYSLLDNLDLALYFQFFNSKINVLGYELKSSTSFAFLRLKWSF